MLLRICQHPRQSRIEIPSCGPTKNPQSGYLPAKNQLPLEGGPPCRDRSHCVPWKISIAASSPVKEERTSFTLCHLFFRLSFRQSKFNRATTLYHSLNYVFLLFFFFFFLSWKLRFAPIILLRLPLSLLSISQIKISTLINFSCHIPFCITFQTILEIHSLKNSLQNRGISPFLYSFNLPN